MEKTNVKVYFFASADDFSVEDFTNTLGLKPTRALNKIVIVEGTLYRLGTEWELGTDYEESLDINKQLNFVYGVSYRTDTFVDWLNNVRCTGEKCCKINRHFK